MKTLFLSSEVVPYAKTGGLADVSGALPANLMSLGCDVRVVTPYYRSTRLAGKHYIYNVLANNIDILIGNTRLSGDILSIENIQGVPVYFVRCDYYFDREGLYGANKSDYQDNAERYIFFVRCALEACKRLQFVPDVIHCHDWQTGLVSAYVRDTERASDYFLRTATVFTIHNLAYQGIFPPGAFDLTGLPKSFFNVAGLEYWGNMSMLKAGLVYSDLITTVSSRYCQEIQTVEYGCGMEGVISRRRDDLYGVLNGADYDEWNPGCDRHIAMPYGIHNLAGKATCKRDLLQMFQLPMRLMERPVFGCISRLVDQKGFDLIAQIFDALMRLDVGFVLLGTGDEKYEQFFRAAGKKYTENAGIMIAYDNGIAHKIEAGCDMFLMPSHYEPCGLNQIYSLKYGCIPIVRATGGLDDTIDDYDLASGQGNGFKFTQYSAAALLATIRRAVRLYQSNDVWQHIMKAAMLCNFSWARSARTYLDLYHLAMNKKHSRN